MCSTMDRANQAVAKTSTASPCPVFFQSPRSLFPSRWRSDQDGRTQHVLAPLAEAGGGGGLWGARLGGAEPLVGGKPHIGVAPDHSLGHTPRGEAGLEALSRCMLEPRRGDPHIRP